MQRPSKDRRTRRTRGLLHQAIMSLIREKGYESISVREILDRADVGRSTFYAHFADKDDLLASGLRDLLQAASSDLPVPSKRHERIVRFSLPVFELIHRQHGAGHPPMGVRGRAILHEHLQAALAGSIADDVKKELHGRRRTANGLTPDLLARYVASTFILVLNEWMESGGATPPKEVDALFRALVLPALASSL